MEENKQSFKDKWNSELDKKDLKKVLIKGLIGMIAAVVLASFVDYLLFRINASFFVAILIIGAFIGVIINNSFKQYHIKYTFIALIYTFIGMILLNFFRLVLIYGFSEIGTILSSGEAWFMIFLHPIRAIVNAVRIGEIGNYIFSIIELVLYIGTFFFAYILSKKKHEEKNGQ
jgi:hypothetical protein